MPSDDDVVRHGRDRDHRLDAIDRWVEYIVAEPPDVWGPQLNRLIDGQLAAARDSDVSVETRRRVDAIGRDRRKRD